MKNQGSSKIGNKTGMTSRSASLEEKSLGIESSIVVSPDNEYFVDNFQMAHFF